MATIVIVNYRPGEAQRAASPENWREGAERLAALDGLRWKYWLRDDEDGTLGGVYLFGTVDQARAGGNAVSASLAAAGASEVVMRFFAVDARLSALTRGTLPPEASQPENAADLRGDGTAPVTGTEG